MCWYCFWMLFVKNDGKMWNKEKSESNAYGKNGEIKTIFLIATTRKTMVNARTCSTTNLKRNKNQQHAVRFARVWRKKENIIFHISASARTLAMAERKSWWWHRFASRDDRDEKIRSLNQWRKKQRNRLKIDSKKNNEF